jgi:hypothetical protein
MKTIKKNELYENLGDFLKSKGIEFKDGVYAHRISSACDLLTDAINDTNKTVKRARVKIGAGLEQLRQSIHDATAPKPAPAAASATRARKKTGARRASGPGKKSRKAK